MMVDFTLVTAIVILSAYLGAVLAFHFYFSSSERINDGILTNVLEKRGNDKSLTTPSNFIDGQGQTLSGRTRSTETRPKIIIESDKDGKGEGKITTPSVQPRQREIKKLTEPDPFGQPKMNEEVSKPAEPDQLKVTETTSEASMSPFYEQLRYHKLPTSPINPHQISVNSSPLQVETLFPTSPIPMGVSTEQFRRERAEEILREAHRPVTEREELSSPIPIKKVEIETIEKGSTPSEPHRSSDMIKERLMPSDTIEEGSPTSFEPQPLNISTKILRDEEKSFSNGPEGGNSASDNTKVEYIPQNSSQEISSQRQVTWTNFTEYVPSEPVRRKDFIDTFKLEDDFYKNSGWHSTNQTIQKLSLTYFSRNNLLSFGEIAYLGEDSKLFICKKMEEYGFCLRHDILIFSDSLNPFQNDLNLPLVWKPIEIPLTQLTDEMAFAKLISAKESGICIFADSQRTRNIIISTLNLPPVVACVLPKDQQIIQILSRPSTISFYTPNNGDKIFIVSYQILKIIEDLRVDPKTSTMELAKTLYDRSNNLELVNPILVVADIICS